MVSSSNNQTLYFCVRITAMNIGDFTATEVSALLSKLTTNLQVAGARDSVMQMSSFRINM